MDTQARPREGEPSRIQSAAALLDTRPNLGMRSPTNSRAASRLRVTLRPSAHRPGRLPGPLPRSSKRSGWSLRYNILRVGLSADTAPSQLSAKRSLSMVHGQRLRCAP
jgi:hypothetical protein